MRLTPCIQVLLCDKLRKILNIKVRLFLSVVNEGGAHEGGSDRGGRSQLRGAGITCTPGHAGHTCVLS